jgi:hypothetical protein
VSHTSPNGRAAAIEYPDFKRSTLLGDEIGTPYDEQSVFGDYADGTVFEYDPWSATEMTTMLGRDGKAALVEQVLTAPVARLDWSFVPAPEDTGQAEFLAAAFAGDSGAMSVPMQFIVAQATSAFMVRKAFFEKVFKVADGGPLAGRIVYDKIAYRPAGTCTVAREARHGAFRGFRQVPYYAVAEPIRRLPPDGWLHIPAPRAWVYVHGQHRDPMRGISSMEITHWAYQTKIKLRWLWMRFLEKQVVPGALVRGQAARDTAGKLAALKAGGIAWTDDVASEIREWGTGSAGTADQFVAAIRFLDSEMANSVLAGFTSLTDSASEGRGSFALSKDASDFFLKSRQAAADELAHSINEYLVTPLIRYNFGPNAPAPRFTFGQMIDAPISDVLSLFGSLATAQTPAVPPEFVRQLAEKVAAYMDLDPERLHKAFGAAAVHGRQTAEQSAARTGQAGEQAARRAARVAGTAAAVNAATRIVAAPERRRERSR